MVDEFVDIHPTIAPIITNTSVLIFRDRGRFVGSAYLGIAQSMAEPVVIDNSAIIIIGLITLISSLDDECGLCSRGPHTVATENRIE